MTSNLFEAILLYFCFKAIEKQNDTVEELIGQDQYRKRKRYSKNDTYSMFPIKRTVFLCTATVLKNTVRLIGNIE